MWRDVGQCMWRSAVLPMSPWGLLPCPLRALIPPVLHTSTPHFSSNGSMPAAPFATTHITTHASTPTGSSLPLPHPRVHTHRIKPAAATATAKPVVAALLVDADFDGDLGGAGAAPPPPPPPQPVLAAPPGEEAAPPAPLMKQVCVQGGWMCGYMDGWVRGRKTGRDTWCTGCTSCWARGN